ncbi:ubiquitin-like protein 7 [Aricia agestis]|uniref:ubiquitin-like protein 7 n=1 Tax=Aricia agestis TaxID=91739 RepID=UPI001C203B82|nr:ubiquitin-like protein 7 [Aricia agestis]
MENQQFLFLGIKVKPGPIERHKLENFSLENSVLKLKNEAETKANLPASSLELVHHGKILKDNDTLNNSGVKNGEMVHVLKKKLPNPPPPPPTYTDAQLQQLNSELRTLGCTPNAPGWTRAMQLLNDESAMAEIIEQIPSLADDCMTSSILHEVELLAALGANVQTMRRGAEAYPDLPNALRMLLRLVRSRSTSGTTDNAPTSGFAYSLEALSEDEEGDEEEAEGEEGEARNTITQELLAAALRAATEAAISSNVRGSEALQTPAAASPATPLTPAAPGASSSGGGARAAITPEMFSEAISAALSQAPAPMDQSANASSSQSPAANEEDYSTQLRHMQEMGLTDVALNVRALIICGGDVNAAINLVFSGAIGDDSI